MAISLPCGMIRSLKSDMQELVDGCRRDVPRTFDSEDYSHRIEQAMKDIEPRRQSMTAALDKQALEAGFMIRSTPAGVTPVPLKDGQPMSQEDFEALPDAEQKLLRTQTDEIQHAVNHGMSEIRRLGKEAATQTAEVDREVVRFTLTPIIEELQGKYAEFPAIVSYLNQVEPDMMAHVNAFKPGDQQARAAGLPGGSGRGR